MGDTRPPRRPLAVRREARTQVAFEVKITAAVVDTYNQPAYAYRTKNELTTLNMGLIADLGAIPGLDG